MRRAPGGPHAAAPARHVRLFDDGAKLGRLAQFYARALLASGIEFDVIFGPAYKGIPLGAAVAVELARLGVNKPFAYNRKEAKDHGEGGVLVGAPLRGRNRAAGATTPGAAGATPHAVVIALDRQEKATENGQDVSWSAVNHVRDELGLQVCAIARLAHLLRHLGATDQFLQHYEAVSAYRARYGVDESAAP